MQIFGTDIDSKAIEKARLGSYVQNIVSDVSPERLKRFFIKEDSHYRVKSDIREMVVFAEQNVLCGPAVFQAGSAGVPQPADLSQAGCPERG